MKTLIIVLLLSLSVWTCVDDYRARETKEVNPEKKETMEETRQKYGIAGLEAPELRVSQWVDAKGRKMDSVKLADSKGKLRVIYCFQSWCPGCHSIGLPSLQKMVERFKDSNEIEFMAIQTVFEGKSSNTFEKMLETQERYKLEIPFGHDEGDSSTGNRSATMHDYKTGGTPWFIFIDRDDTVIFNDFHVDTDKAIQFLSQEIKS